MGLVAGPSNAAILWLVMRMEELHGQRAGELQGAAGFGVAPRRARGHQDACDALIVRDVGHIAMP
jgi:hypothetical protein